MKFIHLLALQLSLTTLLADISSLPNQDSRNHGGVEASASPSSTPTAAIIPLEGKYVN